ncbi:hypothetical protein MY10362_009778 [Beauveria mimosiformis]
MNYATTKFIEGNPIGSGLDTFRALLISTCRRRSIPPDAIAQLGKEGKLKLAVQQTILTIADLQHLSLNLLVALQNLPAASLVPSKAGRGALKADLLRLLSAVTTKHFEFDRIKPLLKATIDENPDDALIWDLVSAAAVESTPPPRTTASSIQQTPWSQSTSGIINSSEFRRDVDRILKVELGPLYVGIPFFDKAFFGGVPNLKTTSEIVFQKCQEGENPLFDNEGWTGWQNGAKEGDVLTWFNGLIPKLEAAAPDHISNRRKLLAQPKTPLRGSTGKRSMDIGFVNSDITYEPEQESRYRWLHVLVAGELKSNPAADIPSLAQIDLATYVREVLTAQDARRFVLGFTLCGSLMRLWEFDRLGGIGSDQFDINKKDGGLQFVATILGFLQMDEVKLGFDPTIITSNGERYIEIKRHSQTERLIIDEDMKRAPCIAGRATTCWKAHHEEDPQTPLVIKDSWQYTDREEEGKMLQEATKKGVVNVARYYHHETIRVNGVDDDIQSNLRNGLDVTKATNYRTGRSALATDANDGRTVRRFEKWNYVDTEELAELKKGQVSHEQDFIKTTEEYFTQHYRPLIPSVNRLRKVVFPSGRRWEKENDGLYLQMQDIIREARNDTAIIASKD